MFLNAYFRSIQLTRPSSRCHASTTSLFVIQFVWSENAWYCYATQKHKLSVLLSVIVLWQKHVNLRGLGKEQGALFYSWVTRINVTLNSHLLPLYCKTSLTAEVYIPTNKEPQLMACCWSRSSTELMWAKRIDELLPQKQVCLCLWCGFMITWMSVSYHLSPQICMLWYGLWAVMFIR